MIYNVAWLAAVLYAVFIYNPAAIAAAQPGSHFPEARYDNNTIASTILGCWLYPALAILARRLGGFVIATVNPVFGPIFKPGLGCFSPARHFPLASSARLSRQFAYAAAFPANLFNATLNRTRAKSRAAR